MKKSDWVWQPHAAHLVIGSQCQFHVATYVGGYIVSTVGEWWPDRVSREIHARIFDHEWHIENNHLRGDNYDRAYRRHFGFMEIGSDTKYETMVFEAEADTENTCCPWVMKTPRNIDGDRYNSAPEAMQGHLRLCEQWAKQEAATNEI